MNAAEHYDVIIIGSGTGDGYDGSQTRDVRQGAEKWQKTARLFPAIECLE